MRHGPPRNVVLVLPEQVQLLDVAGPAQVFVAASEVGGAYDVRYVAATPSVGTHQGLPLTAATEWPALGPRDLVIVPGWETSATRAPIAGHLLAAVAEHARLGGHVASVCAGALALAEAGLLTGRRATTHHDLVDRLARHPDVTVVRDVLYTCDGPVHTSAGIASGIDLALHIVSEDHGPALAARVARSLVVPAWRPGGAPQASVMLRHRDHISDVVHRAQDILDDLESGPPTLDRLADRLATSPRTLARHFVQATGLTPHAYGSLVRHEHASQLVAQGWTRQAAATAVGYADARSLRSR